MAVFFTVVGLFVLAVLVMGFRFDRRQRSIRGSRAGKASSSPRLENQTRGDKWGAGGA
jgi:hypothetical protein